MKVSAHVWLADSPTLVLVATYDSEQEASDIAEFLMEHTDSVFLHGMVGNPFE